MKQKRLTSLFVLVGAMLIAGCGETSSVGESSSEILSSSALESSSSSEVAPASSSESVPTPVSSSSELPPEPSSSSESVEEVTIPEGNFVAPEDSEGDLGESIEIEVITSVKDSAGKYHKPSITITDPTGAPVDLDTSDYTFLAEKVGRYQVTYTIHYGAGDALEKSVSYYINITDSSAPFISGGNFRDNNIVALGDTVDLTDLKLEDNSGEDIATTFDVKFGEEDVTLTSNAFVADRKGVYTVHVSGADSSGNAANIDMKIFTTVDGENGEMLPCEYYNLDLNEEKGYDSTKSFRYGWTDDHSSWFHDASLLSSDTGILGTPNYLSFWMYVDAKDPSLDVKTITKYSYYTSYAWGAYGAPVSAYWQFSNSYELPNNAWHLMVFDLTDPVQPDQESQGSCVANPTNLNEIIFGAGLWDGKKQNSNMNSLDILIDDIKVSNELPGVNDFMIQPSIQSVTISEEALTLTVGESTTLTAAAVPSDCVDPSLRWESSDPYVASVSSSGAVMAMGAGDCEIRAVSNANTEIKAICNVHVNADPSALVPDVSKGVTMAYEANIYKGQKENSGNWVTSNAMFDFTLGFGKADSFAPGQVSQDGGNIVPDGSITVSGEPNPGAQNYRFFHQLNVGVIIAFKAKQDMFVSAVTDSRIAGWLQGIIRFVILNADGTIKDVIGTKDFEQDDKLTIYNLDYTFIATGEALVVETCSKWDNTRNVQYPPTFTICPVGTPAKPTIENVKTALLDTENQFSMIEFGLEDGHGRTYEFDMSNPSAYIKHSFTACDDNGWSGLAGDPYDRINFLDMKGWATGNKYTAATDGYFYQKVQFVPWQTHAECAFGITLYINDQPFAQKQYTSLTADQVMVWECAEYLEAGDKAEIIFEWYSLPATLTIGIQQWYASFFASQIEFELPTGFTSLLDYINYVPKQWTLDEVKTELENTTGAVDLCARGLADPANSGYTLSPDGMTVMPLLASDDNLWCGIDGAATGGKKFNMVNLGVAGIYSFVPVAEDSYVRLHLGLVPWQTSTDGVLSMVAYKNQNYNTPIFKKDFSNPTQDVAIEGVFADYFHKGDFIEFGIEWYRTTTTGSFGVTDYSYKTLATTELALPEGINSFNDYAYPAAPLPPAAKTADELKTALLDADGATNLITLIGEHPNSTGYVLLPDAPYYATMKPGGTNGWSGFDGSKLMLKSNMMGVFVARETEADGYVYQKLVLKSPWSTKDLTNFNLVCYINGDYSKPQFVQNVPSCKEGTTAATWEFAEYFPKGTKLEFGIEYNGDLTIANIEWTYKEVANAKVDVPEGYADFTNFVLGKKDVPSYATQAEAYNAMKSVANDTDFYASVLTTCYNGTPNASITPGGDNAWGGYDAGGVKFNIIDDGTKGCNGILYTFTFPESGYVYFKCKFTAWNDLSTQRIIWYNNTPIDGDLAPVTTAKDASTSSMEAFTWVNAGDVIVLDLELWDASTDMKAIALTTAKFAFYPCESQLPQA